MHSVTRIYVQFCRTVAASWPDHH